MTDQPTVTLREHLEAAIAALKREVNLSLEAATAAAGQAAAASKEVLAEAKMALEKRLDSLNESRGALDDLTGRMMPRVESEQRHAAAREKIDQMVQRSEALGHWKTFTDKLEQIDTRLTRIEGAGMGAKGLWSVLLALVGAIGAVVGAVLALHR